MNTNTSNLTRNILITRSRIAQPAIDLLEKNNFKCIFSPPYEQPKQVVQTAKEHDVCAIMVSQGRVTKEVIAASGKVEIIVKHGSGVNNINLFAAEELNIPVYRSLGANATAVAELALTLMLSLRKNIPFLDHATKTGQWLKSDFIGHDVKGAKLGLVGLGQIGAIVADYARYLGIEVFVFDPALQEGDIENITIVDDLDSMLADVDIVSLHCPLIKATKNLINKERLAIMRSTAVLVNTARGGIVDEYELGVALNNGTIAGAALDSFADEPPQGDSTLWGAKNLIVTPHIGGVTKEAENNMATTAAQFIINKFNDVSIDEKYRVSAAEHGGLEE